MTEEREEIGRLPIFIVIVLFFLLISLGCATNYIKKAPDDKEILKGKITEYWQLKINNEVDKTYLFEYPLYRKTVTRVDYMVKYSNPFFTFEGFRIEDIMMENSNATAKLQLDAIFTAPGAKPYHRAISYRDEWVKIDNEWYHVPGKRSSAINEKN